MNMKRKQRKSTISKVVALCLTLVMMLSMSITAMAFDSTTTGTITVNGLNKGTVVSAYKVIDVNVADNGQPENPMYTWNTNVAEWLQTDGGQYSAYIDLEDESVTEDFTEVELEEFRAFWHDLAAAIKGGRIQLDAVSSLESDGESVTFSGLFMGQYLLTADSGMKIYQPTTASLIPEYEDAQGWFLENATVNMKGEEPTITKSLVDPTNDKTVAIGDTVEYQLNVTVPAYPEDSTVTTFIVEDDAQAGLTCNNNVEVFLDGEKITSGYEADYTSENGKDFRITFKEDFVRTFAGAEIVIKYSATVNSDAFAISTLGNTATLTYSTNPYSDVPMSKISTEQVYTYGIDLTKVNKDGAELAGAEFTLSKDTAELKFKETSTGNYVYDDTNGATTIKVNDKGNLILHGLDVGTYTLKETKAPDGYVLPRGEITIVIADANSTEGTANGPDGTIDDGDIVTAKGTIKLYDKATVNENTVVLSVENTSANDAGFTLPITGGMGTMLFTIAGILLMGGAVVLVIAVRRKNHQA